jgi:hypothetical protein
LASDLKSKVAREAATLLYFGAEKEYKQAKTRAAQTLGTHFLPSNLEVALELDKIAEDNEGENRKERLVEMRKEALQIMKLLDAYCPLLIGSVWRGNIRRGSDIDIAVYADDAEEIVDILRAHDVTVLKTAWTTVNKHGRTMTSLHVHAETSGKHGLEIVVRASEEKGEKRKCEIFGDEIKGLKTKNLERLLKDNATQKFIPA